MNSKVKNMKYILENIEVKTPGEFIYYARKGYMYIYIPYGQIWDVYQSLIKLKDENEVLTDHYYNLIFRYYYDWNIKIPLEQFKEEVRSFINHKSPLLRHLAALQLYQDGKKEIAYQISKELEKEKFPFAYSSLAYMAAKDENNPKKAEKLYKKAAKKGVRNAYYNLASIAVKRGDLKRYRKYITIGAQKDSAVALHSLGIDLIKGENGFEKDNSRGCDYVLKAARMGRDLAIRSIVLFTYEGIGFAKDYDICKQWAEYAYKRHIKDAGYYLGLLYLFGDGVEKNEEKAYLYFVEEYNTNHDDQSLTYVGMMLAFGKGVKQDLKTGLIYLKKRFVDGSRLAAEYYVKALYHFAKDYVSAREAVEIACSRFPDDGYLANLASELFYKDLGLGTDHEKVVKYGRIAYKHGYLTYGYANCYLFGYNVTKDTEYGIRLIRELIKEGKSDAAFALLGIAYTFGWFGLQINYPEAIRLLNVVFERNVNLESGQGVVYYSYGAIYMNYYKDRNKAKEFVEWAAKKYNYKPAIEALENWKNITYLK